MPSPSDFEYLVDLSDDRLADELTYAIEHGLTELEAACRWWQQRKRDRGNDFLFIRWGNIHDRPGDEQA